MSKNNFDQQNDSKILYSIRVHDRANDSDPELAFVMSSVNGDVGPWYDMVSGHPDYCWEVLDSLIFFQNYTSEKKDFEVIKNDHVNWKTLKEFPTLSSALKEIEKLREAGDRLAQAVRTSSYDDELEMWEDMRKW
jgi:hypothetical protein